MSSSDNDDAQSDESDYVHVCARSSETVPLALVDEDLSVARKLSQHLREQPLLPSHPLQRTSRSRKSILVLSYRCGTALSKVVVMRATPRQTKHVMNSLDDVLMMLSEIQMH